MCLRWNLTVFSLMPSRAAISLLRRPSVTRRRTSVSRSVRRLVGGGSRVLPAAELGQDSGGGRWGDGGFAAGNGLEHPAQLRALEILEQVALGAGFDGSEEIVLVLAHGEHHDLDLGVGPT